MAYEQVLWLRVMAGLGSGLYTAMAVAKLGAASRPAQAYKLLLFAFAFSQALEMRVPPQRSMNGIYGAFWTCTELATLAAGVADESIGEVLVWGSLCSMAGCGSSSTSIKWARLRTWITPVGTRH